VVRQSQRVRLAIGLSGQYAADDENLSGRENLTMFGRLYRLSPGRARSHTEELRAQFDLIDAAERVVKTYAGGRRRRLDLASALSGRPRVVFLDEPTTGLDPRGRLAMWDVIRERVREGMTILLTTQYLEEVNELANSIAMVDHGKNIASGSADKLKSRIGGERIEVVVRNRADVSRAAELLTSPGDGDSSVDEEGRRITESAPGGALRIVQAVRALEEAGIGIDDIGL